MTEKTCTLCDRPLPNDSYITRGGGTECPMCIACNPKGYQFSACPTHNSKPYGLSEWTKGHGMIECGRGCRVFIPVVLIDTPQFFDMLKYCWDIFPNEELMRECGYWQEFDDMKTTMSLDDLHKLQEVDTYE